MHPELQEEATPTVFGNSIFCDDIRQEVNAKQSLMGVYPQVISIQGTFPFALPKLCISVQFFELNEIALVRNWEIPLVVLGPGQTIDEPALRLSIPVPPDDAKVSSKKLYDKPEQLYMITSLGIVFQPLVINTPGFVRVRALYKDKIIKVGSLRVEQGSLSP
jgi:hypothetical protein